MQHDRRLRAAARAVYDAVYPTEELAPVGFDQAEKYGTIHLSPVGGRRESVLSGQGR